MRLDDVGVRPSRATSKQAPTAVQQRGRHDDAQRDLVHGDQMPMQELDVYSQSFGLGAGAVSPEASRFLEIWRRDGFTVEVVGLHKIFVATAQAALTAEPAVSEAWMRHLTAEAQASRMRAELRSVRTSAERLDASLDWREGASPARGAWREFAAELGVASEAHDRELAPPRNRGARLESDDMARPKG